MSNNTDRPSDLTERPVLRSEFYWKRMIELMLTSIVNQESILEKLDSMLASDGQ